MPPTQSSAARRISFEVVTPFALLATLLLAAIAFVPLASIPFISTKAFILIIGAIITLALYILARLSRGNVILPPPLVLGALWLPAAAYALSAAFSGESFSQAFLSTAFSVDTFGFIIAATLLGTLTALIFRRPPHYQLFFKTLFGAAVALISLEVALLITAQVNPALVPANFSLVGTIVDLAALAGLIIIGSLLALRFLSLENTVRIVLVALTLVALILLALFNAELELIVVGLVSFGLFVESVMRRAPSTGDADLEDVAVLVEDDVGVGEGERSLIAPLAVLALSLFFLIGSSLGNALAEALNVTAIDVRPSWQSTLAVGKEVYASSPVFGSGPATFGREWLTYRDAGLNQTIFWDIDFTTGIGFIPTSFITTGVIGALAWILLALALLYAGVRRVVLSVTSDPYLRFVTVFSFVAAVFLGLLAVMTNPGALTLALLFVCVGLFASVLRYAPRQTQWGVIFARSPRIGFIIVFVFTLLLLASVVGAYLVVERYLGEVSLIRAQAALAEGDLGGARREALRAQGLVASGEAYRLQARIAQGEMTRIANDASLSVSLAQQSFQQELARGVNAALEATRVAGGEYQSWFVLGDLYASVVPLNVEGASDNARAAYEKAQTLNPTSPVTPHALAELEIAAGRNVAAKEFLGKAIALKQDYVPAIFLLSQLEVATGNVTEALQAAEAAAYFTPNNPNVLFQVGVLRAAKRDRAGAIDALSRAVEADPRFANAHYFLAALYAQAGDYDRAGDELATVAALGEDNARAVEPLLRVLAEGKNPFPANLLSLTPPAL